MRNVTSAFGDFQTFWGGGDEEGNQDDFVEQSNDCCSLSPMERLYGFGGCLLAGLVCMILSLVAFAKPIKFALLFTVGNILAVGSTVFLIGPLQQLKMMFDSVRIYATAIYIISVVFALICALLIHSKILTIIAVIIEICALIWYGLSYIPFARRMVSQLFISCCDTSLT